MEIVIKTSDKEKRNKLLMLVPPTVRLLKRLSRHYRFNLPPQLIIMAMRQVNMDHVDPRDRETTLANASWTPERGYTIRYNLAYIKELTPYSLKQVAHEAAHIAEHIMHSTMRHSKNHDRILEYAERLI